MSLALFRKQEGVRGSRASFHPHAPILILFRYDNIVLDLKRQLQDSFKTEEESKKLMAKYSTQLKELTAKIAELKGESQAATGAAGEEQEQRVADLHLQLHATSSKQRKQALQLNLHSLLSDQAKREIG